MDILLLFVIFMSVTVLYVNVRASIAIFKSTALNAFPKLFAYIMVWSLPVLGALLLPKNILPELHAVTYGTGIMTGGDVRGDIGGDSGA